ncbi:hypothetical protein EJ04DRAFT_514218 [Polyplosphaeria fusca]|uniref:Rhodopsin domain-containing protein n=1 Tax=Polyplosphaeria fusca TaxID=682080 RepID=A0A9P4QVX5_9PLEO|nr:hypothetical protein EJ04DRAFT_514218 [Polyplosphaeria fusca]
MRTPLPNAAFRAIAWTFTGLGVLLTIGRFVIHRRKIGKLRWDDFFNGIAVVFLIAFVVTFDIRLDYGVQDRRLALGKIDIRIDIANCFAFFGVIYSVKASFLALYWQIFEISTKFRWAWMFVTLFSIVGFIASLVGIVHGCGARENLTNGEACKNRPRTLYIIIVSMWCVLNVVGDLLLMALPIVMLKPMLMRRSQKIGLAVVFGLVLIITLFDVLRTVYTLSMELMTYQDKILVWTILEPIIAVIVCTLPCYRSLVSPRQNAIATISLPSIRSNMFTQKPGITPIVIVAGAGDNVNRNKAGGETRDKNWRDETRMV